MQSLIKPLHLHKSQYLFHHVAICTFCNLKFSDPCSDPDACGPHAFCRRTSDTDRNCYCKPYYYEDNPGDASDPEIGCVSKCNCKNCLLLFENNSLKY